MYEIGAKLVYGQSGACILTDIREESFAGDKTQYYVFTPALETSSIFIPTTNEMLVNRLRNIISFEEVQQAISQVKDEPFEWISDNRHRSTYFQSILSAADFHQLLLIYKNIYLKKQELIEKGKKTLLTDDSAFKKAEKILLSEIVLANNLSKQEAQELLKEVLK